MCWVLVCEEKRKIITIGQGYGELECLWYGDAKRMEQFRRFLVDTGGSALNLYPDVAQPEAAYEYQDYNYLDLEALP